jgi:DNA-directed RNA polymerase specialized sigma24 family protein
MSVIQHLWRGRRVRVAGAVDQVAVDCPADMAAIYLEYWDLVHRRCLATLGDEQAAEDATQDVFLLALSNFEQVQHDVVRGLLDMARTISYERRRRPAREVFLPNPPHRNGHHDDPAEIAERHGVLSEVWSGLSPVERRYVADKFAGFSFEEIARRNRRKLGTVSSNLFRAREHARSLRGLPALLGVAGWRRLNDLAHRARTTAHSSAAAAAAQPVGTLTLSLTLAGLIAGGVPAASAVAGASPASPMAVVPPAQLPAAAQVGAVAAAGGIGAAAPGSAVPYASPPSPHASNGQSLPISPGSSETPEDTVLYTATPSPNYDTDHTIVALGYGNSCTCTVLLRSSDGGATWQARTGAPDGNQVVLPPAYPRDPTIFVGNSGGASSAADWVAASFDAPFTVLPVPAGAIALPAGFDAGDSRVIVSTTSGVWSYNTASGSLQPLVLETRPGVTPALATPLGALRSGVLAMTSSQAVTPGAVPSGTAVEPSMTLWQCPPGSPCTAGSSVPLAGGAALSTALDYATDPVLAAYQPGGQAVVSRDGGRTFTALRLEDGVSSIASVALGAGSGGPSLWVVAARGSGISLEFAPSLGAAWHEVDHGLPQISGAAGRVVPLGSMRAMYLTSGGGFVCTDDGGAHWQTRCSAG